MRALYRDVDPNPFVPRDPAGRAARCEEILAIQAAALAQRVAHVNCACVVVGISGGLDSSLALLAARRAFERLGRPATDIRAVTLPCFGTTARTKQNAERLCAALGVSFAEINISDTVKSHFRDIGQSENRHDLIYENAQARVRTLVLMDIAGRENGFMIGPGDLSELALGWTTYNGDHMSMYGINAGIPKTLIRHIVRHVADTAADKALKDVLCDILATPVSPELLPPVDGQISQQTEDLVGPYELHDFFLYHTLRWGRSPRRVFDLAKLAFAGTHGVPVIRKWLREFYRRFFSQQYKRNCLPDGPGVLDVSLSPRGGYAMPSDASCAEWLREVDDLPDS